MLLLRTFLEPGLLRQVLLLLTSFGYNRGRWEIWGDNISVLMVLLLMYSM